jgi:signal transduction histidine kinase
MRFRSQLLLLLLSVLVPAFLASGWSIWYVYSDEQQAQEKSLLEAARSFAMIVDNDLRIREATLRTLANSTVLESGNIKSFYEFAKAMAPTPESTIVLRHASGQQLLNTRRPYGEALPSKAASSLAELRNVYGPNDTVVSDLFLGKVAKRLDFAIQVPVKHNPHSNAFLEMGVNVSELQTILQQQRFPATWITTIVDRKGVVLARSHDPERFVGKAVSERSQKILQSSRNGVYHSVTLDEIPVKAYYSRVPLADWSVFISIPESDVRRTAVQAASFLGTSSIVLLAVALLAASWLARRTIKPIEDLGSAAERMGRNEDLSYTPFGIREIDTVARQMAEASTQIRQATAKLEQQVAEAVIKAERAERALQHSQKLEALGRLTGGIAHEFNNVLQTISSAVQLAKLVPKPEHVVPLMEKCSMAVERATALTGQLSAFGRAQEAKLTTVVLNRQIEEFKDLVKGVLPSNIEFKVRLSDVSWPVTVDTLQFELAFLNVVINARDAMPNGGVLTVETGNEHMAQPPGGLPPGEYVRIRISDTGTGMSAEVMAKAFEPFYTTKPVGKGTGLGLAQVYGFARQSHGALVLHSVEGEGTTVEFYLPRSSAQAGGIDGASQEQERSATATGTLLFVEDDTLVKETMVPALKGAGLEVIAASNAEEALAILESGMEVHSVLSDVMMPGKTNGVGLAKVILEKWSSTRVILATGYSDTRIDLPGVKVVAKPYQVADIVRMLKD